MLPASRIGDRGLRHLASLVRLERLDFDGVEVTGEGLKALARLEQLRILNLHQTRIDAAGLRRLAALRKLEMFRAGGPGITDQGVEVLRQLPSLRFVHLMDAPLTDAGLQHFHEMTQLESLQHLDRVAVTDAGLAALHKALPQLHIHLDQTHPPGLEHDHRHDAPPGRGDTPD